MKAASSPRPASAMRIVALDGGTARVFGAPELAAAFLPGDLLVVNDAATIPASLGAHTLAGARLELRLAANLTGARGWTAALLGAGDHRTKTEDRPPPPPVASGDRLIVDGPDGLVALVLRVDPLSRRLVDVSFELPLSRGATEADVWAALYRSGRPVQYAHVPERLALWDVQNPWAARPWSVEMPSAGRSLTLGAIDALRRRGVAVASVTHAAGLSAVGDPAIDAALPLPERYEVPDETARATIRARRVIAVGTSVVRALESAAREGGGRVVAASGTTDLRLGPETPRLVVDAILTGIHDAGTSHYDLLRAFTGEGVLEALAEAAETAGLLGHEFGDGLLVWGSRASARTTTSRRASVPPETRRTSSARSSMTELRIA